MRKRDETTDILCEDANDGSSSPHVGCCSTMVAEPCHRKIEKKPNPPPSFSSRFSGEPQCQATKPLQAGERNLLPHSAILHEGGSVESGYVPNGMT